MSFGTAISQGRGDGGAQSSGCLQRVEGKTAHQRVLWPSVPLKIGDLWSKRRFTRGLPVLRDVAFAPLLALVGFLVASPAPADTDWRDRFERELEASDGRAFFVTLETDGQDRRALGPYVYYPPLSALWAIDAETLADSGVTDIRRTGTVWRVDTVGSRGVEVRWRDGKVDHVSSGRIEPTLVVNPSRHMLAAVYDALLRLPLAAPVAGLPVGSRFQRDGSVLLPHGTEGWAIWVQHGASLTVEHSDGRVVVERADNVFQALQGIAP